MINVSSILWKIIKVSKVNYLACSFPVQQSFKSLQRVFPLRGYVRGSRICPFPVVLGSVLTIALCECESLHDQCTKCGKCKKHPVESDSKCILCSCSQKPITWEKQDLTHGFLLRQANIVTCDAVTRIITETVSAIDDYHDQYRHHLEALNELLEDSRTASDSRQELITCKMMVVRSRIEEMKNNIIELECYLDSVTRLAHATAETAYLAIAEYASVSLMERLNSALTRVKEIKEKTQDIERASNELHSLIIVESGQGLK